MLFWGGDANSPGYVVKGITNLRQEERIVHIEEKVAIEYVRRFFFQARSLAGRVLVEDDRVDVIGQVREVNVDWRARLLHLHQRCRLGRRLEWCIRVQLPVMRAPVTRKIHRNHSTPGGRDRQSKECVGMRGGPLGTWNRNIKYLNRGSFQKKKKKRGGRTSRLAAAVAAAVAGTFVQRPLPIGVDLKVFQRAVLVVIISTLVKSAKQETTYVGSWFNSFSKYWSMRRQFCGAGLLRTPLFSKTGTAIYVKTILADWAFPRRSHIVHT